ncbi:PBSX family phage terminase large subunit [Paenibacillus chitinolyticus]|uniref:PBSX family phage terminase large subunit n=1 Tax=Paenibacillus chitinolyticus TaxID=79263 RepID=UPI00366D118B
MPTINVDLNELPNLTNDKFYPLYNNKDRYLVLMGGGGSGKSVFTAQKVIVRMLTEKKHRFLVLRKVAKTLRESVFMEIKNVIYRWGLESLFKIPKGTSSELHITCINGNEILFAGLDDVEKLKSISGITSIWIEEASETMPEDFRQLDIRLRGRTLHYKQLMITFNPIDVNHWLKKEFFDKPKPNATTIHSTYKDNKFLDNEAIRVLEAFKETDPYFYQVYAMGEWGVLGKTIFNARIVSERISYLRTKAPVKRGFFAFDLGPDGKPVDDSIRWVNDSDSHIVLFEDVKDKHPYVLGGDTAGEGSDYFSGHVIDNTNGKQVARIHQQFDEIDYTRQIYCLGRYYNTALIGLEVNFSTYPTRKLEEWHYPKMYVREAQDSYTHRLEKRFGFQTNKITRPLIVSNLVTIVKESPELLNDISTLEEMLTFVKNQNGRPEAQEGSKDDLIMGLAITYQIRDQQTYTINNQVKFDVSKLPTDLQEDWNRANPEQKKYLAQKWGLTKGA